MLRNKEKGTRFFGEDELAKGMTRHILERFTPMPVTPAPEHG